MKIYILADMEGVSGIVSPEQVDPSKPSYSEGRKYLTWEINACVEGCIEGGADTVYVRDAHHSARNVIWEELSPKAEYIVGKGDNSLIPCLEECDGLILLGHHAMAGTPKAILEHTMSSSGWQNFWINGELAGEIALEAAVAGEFGVPTVMVSGDDKACEEARRIIPGIVTTSVKVGLSGFGGRLLSKKVAHDLIRSKAEEAVKRCKSFMPYEVKAPVTMRLELTERSVMPNLFTKPWIKVIDGRTYEVQANSVIEAFMRL
jgi:D-amino peptidase